MSDASFTLLDTAPSLFGTLTGDDGEPINLAGATVRFQMRDALDRRFSVNAVATIVDAATGSVRYDWADGDLSTVGNFVSRWAITFGDGSAERTIPANSIEVQTP